MRNSSPIRIETKRDRNRGITTRERYHGTPRQAASSRKAWVRNRAMVGRTANPRGPLSPPASASAFSQRGPAPKRPMALFFRRFRVLNQDVRRSS